MDMVKNRILSYLANQNSIQVESYLKRGRKYKDVETSALKDLWVNSFKSWAARQTPELKVSMEDFEAELSLRGEEIPLEQIGLEFDKLIARLSCQLDGLSSECKQEINEDLIEKLKNFEQQSKH